MRQRAESAPVDEIHDRATVRHEVALDAARGMTDEQKLALALDLLDEVNRKAQYRLEVRRVFAELKGSW